MALEASHIRFAIGFKEAGLIADIKKYVSGTIYPDSRYMTKIDRNLTHPLDFMDENFVQGDYFRKGWAAHLLCDKAQYAVMKEHFPEIFESDGGADSARWVNHTALKILQDIEDAKKINIESYLPLLEYVETPNGEDPATVLKYNRVFSDVYKNPTAITVSDYYEIWRSMGLDDELANEVTKQAEAYSKDQRIMNFIFQAYDLILERAKKLTIANNSQ